MYVYSSMYYSLRQYIIKYLWARPKYDCFQSKTSVWEKALQKQQKCTSSFATWRWDGSSYILIQLLLHYVQVPISNMYFHMFPIRRGVYRIPIESLWDPWLLGCARLISADSGLVGSSRWQWETWHDSDGKHCRALVVQGDRQNKRRQGNTPD